MDRFYIITNSDKDKKLEITEKIADYLKTHHKNCEVQQAERKHEVPFIIQILIRFRTIHSVLLFWEEMAHFFRQQGMWCIRKFLFLESIWEIWVFLQK